MNSEARVWRRMMRRLKSSRAAVFLELAMVAPLAVTLVLFAHDFIHICYAEQQNEIGARLLGDLEARAGVPWGKETEGGTERHVKVLEKYMKMALGKDVTDVFWKVKNRPTPGFSKFGSEISKFLNGQGGFGSTNKALEYLGKFIGKSLSVLTLGTHQYLFRPVERDQMISVSVSVKYKTLLPRPLASWLPGGKGRDALVVQRRYKFNTSGIIRSYDAEPDLSSFERQYCTMPSFETVPEAPPTYAVKVRTIFDKFPLWVNLIGRPDD